MSKNRREGRHGTGKKKRLLPQGGKSLRRWKKRKNVSGRLGGRGGLP